MTALLAAFRRERNGAVADAMRLYGSVCGLNYGVSLPTVRRIVAGETADPDLARYLWRQDVRELRLAALHLASPESLAGNDAAFWADGLVNSELAEEAAFALLWRAEDFPVLFDSWIVRADCPLLQYAALLAAARRAGRSEGWIARAADAVRGADALAAAGDIDRYAARLVAQGAVALCAAFGGENETNRQAAVRAAGSAGEGPGGALLREELAWRLPDPRA